MSGWQTSVPHTNVLVPVAVTLGLHHMARTYLPGYTARRTRKRDANWAKSKVGRTWTSRYGKGRGRTDMTRWRISLGTATTTCLEGMKLISLCSDGSLLFILFIYILYILRWDSRLTGFSLEPSRNSEGLLMVRNGTHIGVMNSINQSLPGYTYQAS